MFATISNWEFDEAFTDETRATAQGILPMLTKAGALNAYMVETSDTHATVVTLWPDAETAAAVEKARGAAKEEGGTILSKSAAKVAAHV
jgi:hypothetical protein